MTAETARDTVPQAGTGGTPEFPVTFAGPDDAAHTWERDDMHMPFALTPLGGDFIVHAIGAAFNPYYEAFGAPQRLLPAIWHGWAYFSFRPNVPEAQQEAAEARWVETLRERVPITRAFWNDAVLPELAEIFGSIARVPIDDLPGDAAATAWTDAWAGTARAWVLHFMSIMGPYQVLEDLSDAYATAMGPGRDAEALELIRGSRHELEEVDEGIEALVALAEAGLAELLSAALAKGEPTAEIDLAELRVDPGANRFVDELERFLAQHGHLGQNHDDLQQASWAEAPRLLLGRIVTHLQHPPEPSRERRAALARRAEDLAAAARAALADRPDELARFETTLAHAREIGYLTEGHNYWIDRMSQARLRTLATRTGRRLVREGVLAAPGDVFFLHRDEVADALRDGADRTDLVEQRRAEHARNERLTPPYYVGKIPDKPPTGDRFDGPRVPSPQGDLLKGTGASAGIVRGPARVVLSQEDFGRIGSGDVIVCPSSNPSWVPVFTIAAGLVTNTGGVLSHAAVVAREFGLPAVVGATDATTRIADGRLVEIDGTAGTVRLL
jgi:pyruvate,water dikinase